MEGALLDSGSTNIVMIIVDTLRGDALGCYGQALDTSPEIDELARAGVVFEEVIAQSSWTRPSIGTMLTGLYPRTLGIRSELTDALGPYFLTLAELLKREGFTTVGVTANPNINAAFGFDQGFDRYEDSVRLWSFMSQDDETTALTEPSDPLRRSANDVFALALEHVRELAAPPFYLQLNVMEVHEPRHMLRPEYDGYFGEGDGVDAVKAKYFSVLRQVSHDIGVFVEELTALPGMEDTLFVIVSDHGEGLSDFPAIPRGHGHGRLLYEAHVEVPLVLYHTQGRLPVMRVDQPVRLMDLMPTLVELVGVEPPPGIGGVSLLPFLSGQGDPPALPEFFVTETRFRAMNKLAVYGDEWLYVLNRDEQRGLPPRELQARGGGENGARSSQLGTEQKAARWMEAFRLEWERAHPEAGSTPLDGELSQATRDQLTALGYAE